METYYIPVTTPDGRTIFLPKHLLEQGYYVDNAASVAGPAVPVKPLECVVNPVETVAPETLPEILVEQESETVEQAEVSEQMEMESVHEEPESIPIKEETMQVEEDVHEFVKTTWEFSDLLEEPMAPQMQKAKTFEQEDVVEAAQESTSVSSCSTARESTSVSTATYASSVSSRRISQVSRSSMRSSLCQSESESGLASESGAFNSNPKDMITRKLPGYKTKVALTVRNDCHHNAYMVDELAAGTKVYLIETGLENFPCSRVCAWWKHAFPSKYNILANIDYHRIDGRRLSKMSEATVGLLNLFVDEVDEIKEELALANTKAQIVYFQDGQARRGWVSKVEKGKKTMCPKVVRKDPRGRVVKPTLFMRHMDVFDKTVAVCEKNVMDLLADLELSFHQVSMGKKRVGKGQFEPRDFCFLKFDSHKDATTAMKKLSSHFADHVMTNKVDFSKDYVKLHEVTYPRYM